MSFELAEKRRKQLQKSLEVHIGIRSQYEVSILILIEEFTDFMDIRDNKLRALACRMEEMQYEAENDDGNRNFVFSHEGKQMFLRNFNEHCGESCYIARRFFVCYDDKYCELVNLDNIISNALTRNPFYIVADTWLELATEIVTHMEKYDNCRLCGNVQNQECGICSHCLFNRM